MLPTVIDPPGAIRAALNRRTAEPTTQTQLATYVGLSWRQWTERMRGRVPWRADEIARVARALDVPVSDLIGEEDAQP